MSCFVIGLATGGVAVKTAFDTMFEDVDSALIFAPSGHKIQKSHK